MLWRPSTSRLEMLLLLCAPPSGGCSDEIIFLINLDNSLLIYGSACTNTELFFFFPFKLFQSSTLSRVENLEPVVACCCVAVGQFCQLLEPRQTGMEKFTSLYLKDPGFSQVKKLSTNIESDLET